VRRGHLGVGARAVQLWVSLTCPAGMIAGGGVHEATHAAVQPVFVGSRQGACVEGRGGAATCMATRLAEVAQVHRGSDAGG
jgi:hypothetical protein